MIQIDHGGQYYKRYNQTKHNILESFSLHFQEYGIVAWYNMSGTPQENDVVERRNHTLIRIIMDWSIKKCSYILNQVPCKAISKTPFQLWTSRKPSLKHLHV